MTHPKHVVFSLCFIFCALPLAGCWGSFSDPGGDTALKATSVDPNQNAALPPFEALAPRAYVNKVKNILTGVPATAAEIDQVTHDPTALRGLIAQWQNANEYAPKMITFLSNAFQQSQVFASDFADQGAAVDTASVGKLQSPLLLQNLRESFARTVLAMDAQQQPFNMAMSTHTFLLTPPLATYYAFLDGITIDDKDRMTTTNQGVTLLSLMANYTAADFADWRTYTIRVPKTGEATTQPAAAAAATELVLHKPRQGFYSTPAFFAGWQTNISNQARVTINQTVITALGHAFDGGGSIAPLSTAAITGVHAMPNTPCYGCHLNLDPMRQFFRQAYSIHFSVQTDPNQMQLPGMFAFVGVSTSGASGIDALGTNLAAHPLLAAAWVQKMCTYANDAPCLTNDPEYQRIVALFAAGFSFKNMVAEVFASPLTTYTARTLTTQTSISFPIAKRDHLCPLLSQRLKLPDVCALDPNTVVPGSMKTVQLIASILPANGYSRANTMPVLANDPSLFFRAGVENICAGIAPLVVDAQANDLYKSTAPAAAVASMVHDLMGIAAPNDVQPMAILQSHYDAAVATGAAPVDALKSTFVTACMSPSVVGIGQ